MTAPHPRMHGLTHVPGGADPIPLLPPLGGTVDEIILATLPGAYYKMNETSGVWHDSSGGGRDAVYTGRGTRGIPAPLDENDGSLCAHVDGAVPVAPGGDPSQVGEATDSMFEFAGVSPFTVSALIQPDVDLGMGVCGNTPAIDITSPGWGLLILPGLSAPDDPPRLVFRRQPITGLTQQAVGPRLPAGDWTRVTGVFDGATMGLWVNGEQVASSTGATASLETGSAYRKFLIGACGFGAGVGGTMVPFKGQIDSVVVWDRALTSEEIGLIVGSDPTNPGGGVDEGLVLGLDENGNLVWTHPTVVVSGGGLDDTTPDDTPVESDSGPYAGTPTTGTGWHLQAHTEVVFLVDSTRGRFDVPTMKWTRVPFNTIRILRTWEPTVDADVVKTAWLPDDRGLSGPARDGVLHVNPDMVWSGDQVVNGWISIEYPVLDYLGLPDEDPDIPGFGPRPEEPGPGISAPDTYMRAVRLFNLSAGSPLHMPSSGEPAYVSWHFWDPASGMEVSTYPPPTYPIWDARPLHLPGPYPQMSPTDSKAYYLNYLGDPGWRFDGLSVATTLAAGANLCLQAWQDSPWLIRFSTDRFPVFHGYTGTWRGFPYLRIEFAYDPDTIDHTTGKLLLPAPS